MPTSLLVQHFFDVWIGCYLFVWCAYGGGINQVLLGNLFCTTGRPRLPPPAHQVSAPQHLQS